VAEGSAVASPGPAVEHVVVLMLENRSFDHALGFLRHPAGDGFDGLRPGAHHNCDSEGRAVPATSDGVPFGLDPDHSHRGAETQLGPFGDVTENGGFVRSYEATVHDGSGPSVMRCLDPAVHCPVLSTLALEFAVCTSWFSSVPGETWPNRNFAHAATSDSTVNIEAGLYRDPTIFEQIEKAKASWRIYYDGTPEVWCYPRLWRRRTFIDFLLRRRPRIGNWFESAQFADHVARHDLASYSFIEPAHNEFYSPEGRPRRTNSQHPHNNLDDDADFRAGEALIASVYEALRAEPEVFATTLLVIVYDEHGGLYDHRSPPTATPPGDPVYRDLTRLIGHWLRARADRRHGIPPDKPYDFRRLGVRVPAVLVSPWISPGTVVDQTLEHASIPATVRRLFAPGARPLTGRDAAAGDFASAVTGSTLPGPRPSGGPPNPHGLPLLPDLGHAAPTDGLQPVNEAAPPGPPGTLVPSSRIDHQLVSLADRVQRTLARRPATVLARRRAVRMGQPESLAAPNGELFPAMEPVSLFRASAKTARRSVVRPPLP
jgi:phospholipase C